MFKKSILALIFILSVTGCADVKIRSVKLPEYHEQISRLLISLSLESAPLDTALIAKSLTEKLASRGVTVDVVIRTKLELENPILKEWPKFNPQQVLEISVNKVTRSTYDGNSMTSVVLKNELYAVSASKTVWGAIMGVTLPAVGTDQINADSFADGLIKKLDEDGLLTRR